MSYMNLSDSMPNTSGVPSTHPTFYADQVQREGEPCLEKGLYSQRREQG